MDSIYKTCLATALLLWCSLPSLAQQSAFEKLTQKFKEGEIFHANFSHRRTDSYTGDTVTDSGVIWIGENRYRVQTRNQTVLVDGNTSMVLDDKRNRVIISEYEASEDDFAPSRILNGVDSTYSVTGQNRNEDQISLSLTSEDPFSVFKEVEITLAGDLVPRRIFVIDHADNEIVTSFEEGRFIAPTEDMFHLDYSEEAEIVDMRN